MRIKSSGDFVNDLKIFYERSLDTLQVLTDHAKHPDANMVPELRIQFRDLYDFYKNIMQKYALDPLMDKDFSKNFNKDMFLALNGMNTLFRDPSNENAFDNLQNGLVSASSLAIGLVHGANSAAPMGKTYRSLR